MTKKNENIERLTYSILEAAAAIGVSGKTLQGYIRSGALPHVRIGTRVLIEVEALKRFIESRQQS
jgi:excisionase family DNA binding protein